MVRLEGSFDGLFEAALSSHSLETFGHAVEETPEGDDDQRDDD